ncbi:MAG: molybdopterin-dependent oxidoreductase [Acidobacteria bacterium]|nr:molybdopterin-dependent oxidoreductase [Acidobacteriota bacterium]
MALLSASMTADGKTTLTRRELLRNSLTALGVRLVGFERFPSLVSNQGSNKNIFQGGRYLGPVEFLGEGRIPLETPLGEGLDGRLYTDLSTVTPENPTIPTKRFYVRTRASELLDVRKPWVVKVTGLIEKPREIGMPELRRMVRPAGLHLMECSGNVRLAHFGMLSVADWAGTQINEMLDLFSMDKAATHLLISGFDRYPVPSSTSVAGASWIFTLEELNSAKAFFATEMNGAALTKDHGAPVRLVVPGWYGCASIKWVDQVTVLGEGAATTSQMREFASRTMQQGVPQLVKDYHPAVIEQAAMPIRVEKWLVEGTIKYRVNGIAWGGAHPATGLGIRFSSEFYSQEQFVPVDDFEPKANDPWTFWTHAWTPTKPGLYFIQLRVNDPSVPARRLNAGYYVRSIEITDI